MLREMNKKQQAMKTYHQYTKTNETKGRKKIKQ